jgi:hypothetical protein
VPAAIAVLEITQAMQTDAIRVREVCGTEAAFEYPSDTPRQGTSGRSQAGNIQPNS